MNIALIIKSKKQVTLNLFDEHLKDIAEEKFEDLYTLNFFLQMIPRKYKIEKTLIIFNDLENITDSDQNINKKNIQLLLAEDENSYFIPTNQ
ncbi:MAG TPA: hypothetical protein VN704_09910 [Verrucomicrobiae bacterium]|nr:hypothetical protein [Verrucomicrobiae bacterium]